MLAAAYLFHNDSSTAHQQYIIKYENKKFKRNEKGKKFL